jgi:isopentenyldiphosphate isomerase
MTAGEEWIDLVDADDRVVGRATRAEMRRDNLLHRAVYIIVRDGPGRLFVHRRTTRKDVYPGYWDVTVGGVVGAGEDYETSARRELAEEVGVTSARLVPLFPVRYEDAATRLLGYAFVTRHDGPVTLQAEEIEVGSFVALAEAVRIIREERCCPDGVQVLQRYLANPIAP